MVDKNKLKTISPRKPSGAEDAVERLLHVRSGVPQARHIHCLLPEGARDLEILFPGLTEELVAAGGRRLPFARCFKYNLGGQWLAQPVREARGFETILCSRVLIEQMLCRRLKETPGVSFLEQQYARGLLGDEGAVHGVKLTSGRELRASLVVDATGRGSRADEWVARLGGQRPEKEVIDCGIMYADALVRPAPRDRASRDWHVLRVEHAPGQGKRSGIIYEIENDLWLVGLAGYHGEKPPRHEQDWLRYADGLPDPSLAGYVRRAEVLSPVSRIAATANIRRRWDAVKQPLSGFLAMGDALCAPNPVYGQGMSMACSEAFALDNVLRRVEWPLGGTALPAEVCAEAQSACAAAVEDAWAFASGSDKVRLAIEHNPALFVLSRLFWWAVAIASGLQNLAAGAASEIAGHTAAPPPGRAGGAGSVTQASVECMCGKVRLVFANPEPRTHLECCCVDCRQAAEWAASRGGPPAPAVTSVVYLDNDIVDVRGSQHLSVYRLRGGGATARAVARCCHSILAVDHPAYRGNVVSVPVHACTLAAGASVPQGRIFVKDRDGDADAAPLPPYSGQGPCLRGDEPWSALGLLSLSQPFGREPSAPLRGITLQELFRRLPPPIVLGLRPGQRIGAPPPGDAGRA